jgi:tetraacyldisaccharide 4'-kinase
MKALVPIVMPPLSAVYGAITRARLKLYERGTFHASRLDAFVISVGNMTTGGTGKTPLVEWLALALAREGRQVCILTRGYGRANAAQRVLVSDKENVLATPEQAGDEAFMLADKLKGIAAVISDADRVSAGRWAQRHFGSDTLLLDDGFQHLRVYRDLNIITVDATNPWGGRKLLPFGSLREPLSGMARADCIVLTRTEQVSSTNGMVSELKKFSGGRPVFLSEMRTRRITLLGEKASQDPHLAPQNPIAAFCGIGNPQSFFKQLESKGYQLAMTRAFSDHHPYDQGDVHSLIQDAKHLGVGSLVTTAKDAVKLSSLDFELPCFVLEIEIVINDEERLMAEVRQSIPKLDPL